MEARETPQADGYKVLSIDAWTDGEDGWTWNQWFDAGTLNIDNLDDLDKVWEAMEGQGFLKPGSKLLGLLEDDGHNLVVHDKEDYRPIFAIVYGD